MYRYFLSILFIIFAGTLFAEPSADLHMEPNNASKIIGAVKNTEVMIMLEQQGPWAKVVDLETGLVGWLVLPAEEDELG